MLVVESRASCSSWFANLVADEPSNWGRQRCSLHPSNFQRAIDVWILFKIFITMPVTVVFFW